MKKRKVTGKTQTYYIRSDLADLVEKVADASTDMNKSDVVNLVLEQAMLGDLLASLQDGDKTIG